MSDHTKEPWSQERIPAAFTTFIEGRQIIALTANQADVITVALCPDGTDGANARRIVACVNACAGIQTESLESITSGESGKWNTLNEMFKREAIEHGEQRDKLIASLRLLLDQIDHTKGACSPTEMVGACLEAHVIDRVRTTIEEVEAERLVEGRRFSGVPLARRVVRQTQTGNDDG